MAINRTIFLLALIMASHIFCFGQHDSNTVVYNKMLSRFCMEFSGNCGWLTQKIDGNNLNNGYMNEGSSTNPYKVKFDEHSPYLKGDFSILKYGRNGTLGLGFGISIYNYTTSATMDNFSVQYQSTDYYNNPFKQIITSVGQVNELIHQTHFAIPLLFRYKKEMYRRMTFFTDAGLLLGDITYYVSNSKAVFNYEAIYARPNNSWTYDDPSGNSQFILTKEFIGTHNPALQDTIDRYFSQLRNGKNKYNVGLNEAINLKQDYYSFHYISGGTATLGFNYTSNAYLSVKFGLNITYQLFSNRRLINSKWDDSYKITDKVGSYNSMALGVSESKLTTLGLSVGVVYRFGKKDLDRDKINDEDDRCITESGNIQYCGCGDRDRDGIPDRDDLCPDSSGSVFARGCPDSDGDGVPDFIDLEKYIPGDERLSGRPQPIDTTDGINPTNEINVDFFAFIAFTPGDTSLSQEEKDKLDKLIKNQNISDSRIVIYQYLDDNKLGRLNDGISKHRAEAIIDYLTSGGIDKFRIDNRQYSDVSRYRILKLIAYGEDLPQIGAEPGMENDLGYPFFNNGLNNSRHFSSNGNTGTQGGSNGKKQQANPLLLPTPPPRYTPGSAIDERQPKFNEQKQSKNLNDPTVSAFMQHINDVLGKRGKVSYENDNNSPVQDSVEKYRPESGTYSPRNAPSEKKMSSDFQEHVDSVLNTMGDIEFTDFSTEIEEYNRYADSSIAENNKSADVNRQKFNTLNNIHDTGKEVPEDKTISRLKRDLEFTMEIYESTNGALVSKTEFSLPVDNGCKRRCREEAIRNTLNSQGICKNAKKIVGNKWKCPDGRIIRILVK